MGQTESGGPRDRAERLFEEALSRPVADRRPFIAAACADDPALAAELLSLLDHAQPAEQFFDRLAEVAIPSKMPATVCGGRYEVRGLIGAGGMGAVYRALDTRLAREVALKFLPPHLSIAPDAEQRLLREARAAAALEHGNVCTVHEIGVTDRGWPFIAMALYDGETLRERIRRGPLPTSEALGITVQVVRGLGAAHTRGIVHRDVKPGNIMLTAGGVVKLLDFGLATGRHARPLGGITPGTVPYMSPEQVRGEAIGPESDLWGVGVVLYEMLSGERPFAAATGPELVDAISNVAPPLHLLGASVPPSLIRIVARLLAKNPADRYQHADDLLADLEVALPNRTGDALRPTSRRDRRVLLLVAGVLVVVGSGGAWWGAHGRSVAAAAADAAAMPAAPRTLAVLPFTSDGPGAPDAYLGDGLRHELTRALATVKSIRLVGRTSSSRLSGAQVNVRAVARALNAGTVLTARVEQVAGRVRIHVRLHDGAAGTALWSNTYERSATEMVTLQRELALQIASALEASLSPLERARIGRPGTRSSAALALYLKGRYFANQRTPTAYDRATVYFKQAIVADSQYGAPWAGLAAVYSQQGMAGQLTPKEARERSLAAVLRAVALDDGLADAHAVLGAWRHAYGWETERAERALRRAIELDPGHATARLYYGNVLRSTGRLEEAVAQQAVAVELDPLVPAYHETLAFTLLRAGRKEEALARVQIALELDSTYWRAHAVLGNVLEATQRYDEAGRAYARGNELAGVATHRTTADRARVLALGGREREARRLLAGLRTRAATAGVYDPAVATAFHALGDGAAAYDWLEQAYDQRQPELRFIGGDPRFLPMRAEPRFQELLRRLRLAR